MWLFGKKIVTNADGCLSISIELAFHTFIDAGRTQETHGSETEDFIICSAMDSMGFVYTWIYFPCPPSHMRRVKQLRWMWHAQ